MFIQAKTPLAAFFIAGVSVGVTGVASAQPLQPLQPLWEQLPEQLETGLAVTSVWQYAETSTTSRKNLLSFSYDFWGEYEVFVDAGRGMTGSVGWLVEGGRPIGSSREADLGGDIGSALGINDDLDSEPVYVSELWWRQSLLDGAVILTVGKIDATAAGDAFALDANAVANDQTVQFLATPLVNNVAIPFPDNGVGVNVAFQATDQLAVTLHASDAAAVATVSPFRTLKEDEAFFAGQMLWDASAIELGGLAGGVVRALGWHTTQDDVSGSGFAFTIDQSLTEDLSAFLRYGYADPDVSDFQQSWSGGLQWAAAAIGRPDDAIGLAGVWAEPSDNAEREESLIEAYYRFQVTDWMHVSPDVQYVINPAGNPSSDGVWIGGLRAQIDF